MALPVTLRCHRICIHLSLLHLLSLSKRSSSLRLFPSSTSTGECSPPSSPPVADKRLFRVFFTSVQLFKLSPTPSYSSRLLCHLNSPSSISDSPSIRWIRARCCEPGSHLAARARAPPSVRALPPWLRPRPSSQLSHSLTSRASLHASARLCAPPKSPTTRLHAHVHAPRPRAR